MLRTFLFLFLFGTRVFSQVSKDSVSIDPKYLEDQLYIGVTYNIFANTPDGFVKDGFAYGFSGGFIKDIPFNERRNIGMGVGLGYAFNTHIQNIVVTTNALNLNQANTNQSTYTIKTNSLEFPIEFRWRTSTLKKYKFWRIYTGLHFSYVLNSSSIGERNDELIQFTEVLQLEEWQYAYSLAAGYGTWNFYLHYTLNPFFKGSSSFDDGEVLKMNSFKMGLIFYLL